MGNGPHDLVGQVAIVTGAGNAIGAATALALAAQGVDVVLVARQEAPVHALAQQVRWAGGRAEVVAADVTDEAQARFAVDRAAHAFGRIDILVNNAGLTLLGPATDMTDWRGMLGGDVLGMVRTTQAALPFMGTRSIGRIVTISSVTREALELELSAIPGAGGFGEQMRRHAWRDSVRVTTMGPDMTTPVPCVAAQQRIQPMSCLRPERIAETVISVVRLIDLISWTTCRCGRPPRWPPWTSEDREPLPSSLHSPPPAPAAAQAPRSSLRTRLLSERTGRFQRGDDFGRVDVLEAGSCVTSTHQAAAWVDALVEQDKRVTASSADS